MQAIDDKIVFPQASESDEAAAEPAGEAAQPADKPAEAAETAGTPASDDPPAPARPAANGKPPSEAEMAHEAAVRRLANELEARAKRRRRFGLEGLNGHDEDDEDLGPGLAGWLAAHRERQHLQQAPPRVVLLRRKPTPVAAGDDGATMVARPPIATSEAHDLQPVPREDQAAEATTGTSEDDAAAETGPTPEAQEEAAPHQWSDKAKAALDEMLDELPAETTRLWGREYGLPAPAPRRGGRLAIVALGAVLLTGVAAVALYAAARTNGVALDVAQLRVGLDEVPAEARAAPAPVVMADASDDDAAGLMARDKPLPAPATPAGAPAQVIRVEPTHVVAASVGVLDRAPATAAPAARRATSRTTLLLPNLPAVAQPGVSPPAGIPAEASTEDRPSAGVAAPAPRQDPVRLASTAPMPVPVAAAEPSATPLPAPAPLSPAPPIIDAGELDRMVARADDLLAQGDVVSARLLYERAARQGRAATAARGAGSTYDPLTFARLGVRGIAPDPERALDWYRKAREAGSNDAETDIAQLQAWMRR